VSCFLDTESIVNMPLSGGFDLPWIWDQEIIPRGGSSLLRGVSSDRILSMGGAVSDGGCHLHD